ncbi:uncharacterized protein LOC106022727 [Mesocricetus auratus]|uniref:Uncharacterized protein LOC106022727 n=1 Tax=Mesocricetus auratus TaxID=10036 RepID=A0ABM2YBV3_MESAU|nr:uncharacterized protein LOC106022727 [Mesocricetus auratus]
MWCLQKSDTITNCVKSPIGKTLLFLGTLTNLKCKLVLPKKRPGTGMEVSPEPGNIATSPRFHQKPPLRMVKMTPRKFIYGSDTLRQMCWRCPVVRKVFKQPEIQASASIEGLQIEMEASPEHSNSAASPVCQQNPQGRIAKMISNKRRCVCVIVKEFYQNQHMVPLNENKPQDIASTSRETPHIKTEEVPEHGDNVSSPKDQKIPVQAMKVECRKLTGSTYCGISFSRHMLDKKYLNSHCLFYDAPT